MRKMGKEDEEGNVEMTKRNTHPTLGAELG